MSFDAARKAPWSATCLVVALTLCAGVPAVAAVPAGGVGSEIVAVEFRRDREREQAALVDRLLDRLREAARQAVGPDSQELSLLAGALLMAGMVWAGVMYWRSGGGGLFSEPSRPGRIVQPVGRPRVPRGGPPLHWLNRPPPTFC